MLDTNSLKEKFLTHFGYTATDTFFSPGRINLIGEHIDYSGGYVLPAAISLGITAIVEKRKDNIINVYAQNFEEAFSIDLNHPLNLSKEVGWARYVTSTLQVLQDKNTPLFGADILIDSDLPLGTGLSSSAALECLIAYIFNEKYYNQNRTELAIDAQDAEVKYVGVNCGIMDQFAVANGKKNHAILLNCDSLDFEHIPLDFGDHQLVIINSNTPRVLTESKYNERRSECDAAFQILKQFDVAENLCQVHGISLAYLDDDILYRRAKHAVAENNRVLLATDALAQNELEIFGDLLKQSHHSLSKDYEVSCKEIDDLVHIIEHFSSSLGARMIGGGFGGCVIALVEKSSLDKFIEYISVNYERKTKLKAEFYPCHISDGIARI